MLDFVQLGIDSVYFEFVCIINKRHESGVTVSFLSASVTEGVAINLHISTLIIYNQVAYKNSIITICLHIIQI